MIIIVIINYLFHKVQIRLIFLLLFFDIFQRIIVRLILPIFVEAIEQTFTLFSSILFHIIFSKKKKNDREENWFKRK